MIRSSSHAPLSASKRWAPAPHLCAALLAHCHPTTTCLSRVSVCSLSLAALSLAALALAALALAALALAALALAR